MRYNKKYRCVFQPNLGGGGRGGADINIFRVSISCHSCLNSFLAKYSEINLVYAVQTSHTWPSTAVFSNLRYSRCLYSEGAKQQFEWVPGLDGVSFFLSGFR